MCAQEMADKNARVAPYEFPHCGRHSYTLAFLVRWKDPATIPRSRDGFLPFLILSRFFASFFPFLRWGWFFV